MKPSEQNKADRELVRDAIEHADEKTKEVFETWLVKLEAEKKETLTTKQRAWAQKVAGIETYENLVSEGKVPRGREVPTPAVLRRENLPMKPPGRK